MYDNLTTRDLCFIQPDCNQGFLPASFLNTWTLNAERDPLGRPYLLRNDNNLYIPPARLTLTAKHPLHTFPKAWAEFDEPNIKIQRDKNIFNSLLKKHLNNQLQDNYTCDRLLCPNCHLRTSVAAMSLHNINGE